MSVNCLNKSDFALAVPHSSVHHSHSSQFNCRFHSSEPACESCSIKDQIIRRLLNYHAYGIMETAKDSDSPKHDYSCECSECESKLGNLPVLLQGIEEDQALNLSVPSTSQSGNRKQMNCSFCGKTFTHKGDLNKHLRTHSGEKPYSCDVCKRQFSHTSNLSRHLKVHTGDKPFHCDNCGKQFSRKDKLELHKQTNICKRRGLLKDVK